MSKKGRTNPTTQTAPLDAASTLDPNTLLHAFLDENNLALTVSAISDENSYIEGRGFVLTDKPLLLVTAKHRS